MPSLTERKDKVYANVNVQIPNSLKMKAKILKVNLTQATIAQPLPVSPQKSKRPNRDSKYRLGAVTGCNLSLIKLSGKSTGH